MLALLIAFIVVPTVEIYVIVQVGHALGALNTVGVLLLLSIVGAWLAKHEGLSVLSRLRDQLDRGTMPTNELIDGVLVFAGGLLLLTPGFVTDAVGLLLLFPPTRAIARVTVKRRFRVRISGLGTLRPPGRAEPDDVIDI